MSREETINDVLNYLYQEIVINTEAIEKLKVKSLDTKESKLAWITTQRIQKLSEKVENIEKLRSQLNNIF